MSEVPLYRADLPIGTRTALGSFSRTMCRSKGLSYGRCASLFARNSCTLIEGFVVKGCRVWRQRDVTRWGCNTWHPPWFVVVGETCPCNFHPSGLLRASALTCRSISLVGVKWSCLRINEQAIPLRSLLRLA